MKRNTISVFCRHSPRGAGELAFAVDLLKLLGAEKLVLHLEQDPTYAQVRTAEDFDEVQRTRFVQLVLALYANLTAEQLEVRFFKAGADKQQLVADSLILVDRRPDFHCPELYTPVLIPLDEPGLRCRGQGSILLPFGDGRSALRAAQLAVPIAAKLAMKIVLYHTTWLEPDITSCDPADHASTGARQTQAELEAVVAAAGVACEVVIEATDDTVEGIVQCAMREQARLIVMARRLKPGIGCYVFRALKQSPVPLLIADDGGKRRPA